MTATTTRPERIGGKGSILARPSILILVAGAALASCTTNTTVVQGSKAGGSVCDYDNECASNSCLGGKGSGTASSTSSGGEETSGGERGVAPETPSLRPLGTCANVATSSSSSGASGADAGSTVTCGEEGMYCKGNVLRSCATDQVVRDCATCKYVGAGTGSEYSTSCRDQAADCKTCTSEKPWSGPGCYFGGGPAVCR